VLVTVLGLVQEGARGRTRAELDSLFGDFDPGAALDVPELAVANGRQTVALPARSGVEMLVLLPDTSLDQPLDPPVCEVRDRTSVALSLPKVDVATAGGVRAMFSSDADLAGPPGREPDRARGGVARRRAGLEGAAATAVMIGRRARPSRRADPIVVQVDRPFLLAVGHTRSKAIYLLAQVARP
jgi:hypothetical protein